MAAMKLLNDCENLLEKSQAEEHLDLKLKTYKIIADAWNLQGNIKICAEYLNKALKNAMKFDDIEKFDNI